MFSLKNIFVFLLSLVSLCLSLIVLNHFGINKIANILITSLIFGGFITLYFKDLKYCLFLFFIFYGSLLLMIPSMEVVIMLTTSLFTFFLINSGQYADFRNIEFGKSKTIEMD
ncbi:hypothetical protein [Acinetobacter ihumii]|uniref:hypothetical protein n=1 Tax=Acinetobacter ihumii TaxID=2483802 RepID=UPI001030BB3E|nr:hypothetical protein [Acinetobacter ihumii]